MPSIAEKQQSIVSDFEFFDDWSDRYRHIIDDISQPGSI